MYIELSKNGQVVLSAKTDHDPSQGNIHDCLRVNYEGDVSLLSRTDEFAYASMVVAAFESAELHHKLDISGDYKRCVLGRSRLEPQENVSMEWPKELSEQIRGASLFGPV